ncbi:MAG TPA: PaaI family thioesterase [Candidatus Nitrosotalea sp.]|nr:PaaI family thioesterase [Candidatus Nitrosotalea sp.]
MLQVLYDGHCFGCGERNPDGLGMRFVDQGGESVCEFTVDGRFQSWAGIVHGGIVSLLLDEAVGWAAWHAGHPGVTAKLEVRLRQPLRIGDPVRVSGRVLSHRHRLIQTSAAIDRAADGSRVAEATASLIATPTAIRPDSGLPGSPTR